MRTARPILGCLLLSLTVWSCAFQADRPENSGASPETSTSAAGGSGSVAGLPAAPAGQRWVGFRGVMVSVPATWGTTTEQCGSVEGDTVAFRGKAWASVDCSSRPTRGVSSLTISRASWHAIPLGRRVDLGMQVGRHEITHSGTSCRGDAGASTCAVTFLVPAADAVFLARAQGSGARALVESIRGSLRSVPAGLTAVPHITYGASSSEAKSALEAAALVPRLPEVDFPHYATGTTPAAGTIVEVGSRVDVLVGDG